MNYDVAGGVTSHKMVPKMAIILNNIHKVIFSLKSMKK